MTLPVVFDPLLGVTALELPRKVARIQAAEMGAAPTQVDSMWWKRRADGHIVDGNDLRAGEHRHSGDLQSLLIELRYQRRTDFLKQPPQLVLRGSYPLKLLAASPVVFSALALKNTCTPRAQ